ncbi:MAG TPA: hypothetical protein VKA95_09010 [Nitrososphaeraceae archaeon]|nr:hypothetical protein [Nitrososphaeraceae archaeon]
MQTWLHHIPLSASKLRVCLLALEKHHYFYMPPTLFFLLPLFFSSIPYLTLILKKEAFATVVGRHILDRRERREWNRKECFESTANQTITISGMVATLFLDSLLSFLLIATWKALLHLTF